MNIEKLTFPIKASGNKLLNSIGRPFARISESTYSESEATALWIAAAMNEKHARESAPSVEPLGVGALKKGEFYLDVDGVKAEIVAIHVDEPCVEHTCHFSDGTTCGDLHRCRTGDFINSYPTRITEVHDDRN